MKIKSLVLIFICLLNFTAKSQNIHPCGTDEMFEYKASLDPTLLMQRQENDNRIREWIETHPMPQNKGAGDPNYTIPLVIHIINDEGATSDIISEADINSGISILNTDFRKQNWDTTNTRSLFQPYGADFEIEFKLATIDPNGNCTKGITRSYSSLTNLATDDVKGVINWDPNKYFNIWVVRSIADIGGITPAGYAQFPGTGNLNTYGIVIMATWFSAFPNRTLTHEVGHCLNLYHTHEDFLGGCGSACSTGGDQVCDTPQENEASFEFSCNPPLNDCDDTGTGLDAGLGADPPNPTENYMSYSSCQNMFTAGQKTRTYAAIGSFSEFSTLTSASNLIATGTAPGTVAGLCADFEIASNATIACAEKSVSFNDLTFGGTPTDWEWDFGDGSTSTEQNPMHAYTSTGTYTVTLTAKHATDSSTTIKSDLIQIEPIAGGIVSPVYESFENGNFPNLSDPLKEWTVVNGSNAQWARNTDISYSGFASYALKLSSIPSGRSYELTSPTIDFSTTNCNSVEFQYAYSARFSSNTDALKIYASKDCGATWSTVMVKSGTTFSTTGELISSSFEPTEDQWSKETVNLSSYTGRDHILLKFELVTGGGNYFYIDDINIGCSDQVGIAEQVNMNLQVYPNPFEDDATIDLTLEQPETVELTIFNVLGEQLYGRSNFYSGGNNRINLADLIEFSEKGVYFVTVKSGRGTITRKLVRY